MLHETIHFLKHCQAATANCACLAGNYALQARQAVVVQAALFVASAAPAGAKCNHFMQATACANHFPFQLCRASAKTVSQSAPNGQGNAANTLSHAIHM